MFFESLNFQELSAAAAADETCFASPGKKGEGTSLKIFIHRFAVR